MELVEREGVREGGVEGDTRPVVFCVKIRWRAS